MPAEEDKLVKKLMDSESFRKQYKKLKAKKAGFSKKFPTLEAFARATAKNQLKKADLDEESALTLVASGFEDERIQIIASIKPAEEGDPLLELAAVKKHRDVPGRCVAAIDITMLAAKSDHPSGPIVLSAENAEKVWGQLVGMPVYADASSGFSQHWGRTGERVAIGSHAAVQIVPKKNGKALVRAGAVLWEQEHQQLVDAIKDFLPKLGASYEITPHFDEDDAIRYEGGVIYVDKYTPGGTAIVRKKVAAHKGTRLLVAEMGDEAPEPAPADATQKVAGATDDPPGDRAGPAPDRVTVKRSKRRIGGVMNDVVQSILDKLGEEDRAIASAALKEHISSKVSAAVSEKLTPLEAELGTLRGERDTLKSEVTKLEAELNIHKEAEQTAQRQLLVATKMDEMVKSGKYRAEDEAKLKPFVTKIVAGEAFTAEEMELFADLRVTEPGLRVLAGSISTDTESPVAKASADAYREQLQRRGLAPSGKKGG